MHYQFDLPFVVHPAVGRAMVLVDGSEDDIDHNHLHVNNRRHVSNFFFYFIVWVLRTGCDESVVSVSVAVATAVDVGGVDAVVDGSGMLVTMSAGAADDIIFRSVNNSSRLLFLYFLMYSLRSTFGRGARSFLTRGRCTFGFLHERIYATPSRLTRFLRSSSHSTVGVIGVVEVGVVVMVGGVGVDIFNFFCFVLFSFLL